MPDAYCLSCHIPLHAGADFCPACGTPKGRGAEWRPANGLREEVIMPMVAPRAPTLNVVHHTATYDDAPRYRERRRYYSRDDDRRAPPVLGVTALVLAIASFFVFPFILALGAVVVGAIALGYRDWLGLAAVVVALLSAVLALDMYGML